MEADSVVFIILGVLAVMVGMAPVLGIIEDFGSTGITPHSNVDDVERLAGAVEDGCERLEDYNSVLAVTIDITILEEQLDNEIELEKSGVDGYFDVDGEEVEFECRAATDVELTANGASGSFGAGSWEATVSGSDDTVEVEMES